MGGGVLSFVWARWRAERREERDAGGRWDLRWALVPGEDEEAEERWKGKSECERKENETRRAFVDRFSIWRRALLCKTNDTKPLSFAGPLDLLFNAISTQD